MSLERPVSALGWELRTHMALRRVVRLILSERCDGVMRNAEGQRVLEGRIESVSATNAYCVVQRRHVPLDEVLTVTRQAAASDPTDPLDRAADDLRARMEAA